MSLLQNEKSTLEAILEEELEVDNFKGPEPVGCWESFIKGISSIWSTIDLRTRKETDIALSKSDPEKGIRSAEDEEKEKKRKALQVRARHMFSRIL